MFSWCNQLITEIEQTYELVQSKYKYVGLTGSVAIFYIIMKNIFFSNDLSKYLTEFGFSETNIPNNIDFIVFSNESIIYEMIIGTYISNQTMTRSKTFIDPRNNKSFNIILCNRGKCMKINVFDNIYIININMILSLYEDQNKESDLDKVNFINKYINIFSSDKIKYYEFCKKNFDRRKSFFGKIHNEINNEQINNFLFTDDLEYILEDISDSELE